MNNRISLLIISLLLFGCGQQHNEPNSVATSDADANVISLTEAQMRNAGIETSTPETTHIAPTIHVFGVIDVPPQNMISVSLPLGGYLKSTQLLPGMHVSKGEVIAVVEDQQFIQLQQEYLTAKARLLLAEKESQRQRELNRNKAGSDKNLQQAETDLATQRIRLASLAEQLRLIQLDPERLSEQTISRSIKVYSPIAGFVKKVNVNIGKYVMPSEVLFELVNPEDIHLNLKVFEKDLSSLRLGQHVSAYSNENPSRTYDCEIILISQDLKADRSAEVHCHFEQYDKVLLPGMYMNADIRMDSRTVTTVPEAAVVNFENQDYIFIGKNKGQFELMPVRTGESQKGQVVIEGINPDLIRQQIVSKGAYSLLMQMKNSGE